MQETTNHVGGKGAESVAPTPLTPSPTLTAESPVGWYECREKGRRILRRSFWWSGARLFLSPDDNLGVAMVGYTDFIGPLVPATDLAAAREEIERLTKERTLLAAGIAKLAIAAGIIQDQNLAGPQLLCLVDDLAAEIERLKAGESRLDRDRLESWAAMACEYLEFAAKTYDEVNGAALVLSIYRDLPRDTAPAPAQQARLAAMQTDPHPQPSGDAAKG